MRRPGGGRPHCVGELRGGEPLRFCNHLGFRVPGEKFKGETVGCNLFVVGLRVHWSYALKVDDRCVVLDVPEARVTYLVR
jgi:hypothetical protein